MNLFFRLHRIAIFMASGQVIAARQAVLPKRSRPTCLDGKNEYPLRLTAILQINPI